MVSLVNLSWSVIFMPFLNFIFVPVSSILNFSFVRLMIKPSRTNYKHISDDFPFILDTIPVVEKGCRSRIVLTEKSELVSE